jgi:menaquinone-dependent protoporphyrinogen oxidase
MKVLVAVASKHGATEEIARAIGRWLERHELEVDVRKAEDVADLDPYGAVVLGSAVYMGRWLEPARAFAERHAADLATRPTWLFSSGPLGAPPTPDPDKAVQIDELMALTRARDHRIFPGRLDRRLLSLPARAVVRTVHAPYGDFRDWAAIGDWADGIGDALEVIRLARLRNRHSLTAP